MSFNLRTTDGEGYLDRFEDEAVALDEARRYARTFREPIKIFESEPWDETDDPGTLRWTVHPDGRREQGHTGSRQFA